MKNQFISSLSETDYHADRTSISKSGLDQIRKSPAHYMAYLQEPREPTRAMLIGSAMHCAILEPHRYRDLYTVADADDRRSKEYKATVEGMPEHEVLTRTEGHWIQSMAEAVHAHTGARSLLGGKGDAELSGFATDPATGVRIRCRYDYLLSDTPISVDLKKTQDARPNAVQRSIANYRYHVQAAMYAHVYEQITGAQLQAMAFIFVEERPPHAVTVVTLPPAAVEQGYREMRDDLALYAECVASGEWPAYGDAVNVVDLPQWYYRMMEEA